MYQLKKYLYYLNEKYIEKQINVYWEKDVPNSFKWTADSNITMINLLSSTSPCKVKLEVTIYFNMVRL